MIGDTGVARTDKISDNIVSSSFSRGLDHYVIVH